MKEDAIFPMKFVASTGIIYDDINTAQDLTANYGLEL